MQGKGKRIVNLRGKNRNKSRNTLKIKGPTPRVGPGNGEADAVLSQLRDFVGLRSFLPLDDFELYRVALLQGFEAFTLNGRVMDEDIGSAVLADKSIPLAVVEPL